MTKRPAYSNLVKTMREGKFLFTGELEPKKMTEMSSILHSAEEMKKTAMDLQDQEEEMQANQKKPSLYTVTN